MDCLAEPLTMEKTWETDGVTVLTAALTLPQLSGSTHRTRRFNRYYRRIGKAYLAYCEQELAPRAAQQCRAAMERSAPWYTAHAVLRHTVALQRGELLSLYIDAKEDFGESSHFTIRRAETWDLGSCLPMPLCEFFPAHTRIRKILLRFAREKAAQNMERGVAAYRENYRVLLRKYFSSRNFYLTESGLCLFYPMYSLGGAAEGIVSFAVPYNDENGPFLPPAP